MFELFADALVTVCQMKKKKLKSGVWGCASVCGCVKHIVVGTLKVKASQFTAFLSGVAFVNENTLLIKSYQKLWPQRVRNGSVMVPRHIAL